MPYDKTMMEQVRPAGRVAALISKAFRAAIRLVAHSPFWSFSLAAGILGAVVFACNSEWLFGRLPMMDDSVAALYQGRIFASGNVVWPMPPDLKPWFDVFGVITPLGKPGVWAGMYPPGWPLALAAGVWIGAPWLVNPVLGGCLIAAVSGLGRELYNDLTGRVAAVMCLFSPMVGVVSATHLSHTSAALGCTLAWWSALRLQATGSYLHALLTGLGLAAVLLIRPEAAVLIGTVIAIGILVRLRRSLELWRQLTVILAIVVLAGLVLLGFQFVASGKAGLLGHHIELGPKAELGFGRVGDSSYVYTPAKAVNHTLGRLQALDRWLLGWPIPLVLLVLTPFLLRRAGWRDLWLLAPVAALSGLFFFYWYFEEWLPGRYLFPAAPMLLVLAARGWYLWHDRLRAVRRLAWLPALVFIGGAAYSATAGIPDYHGHFPRHHGDVERNLGEVMKKYDVSHALVFMHSFAKLPNGKWNDYYATGFMRNALDLDSDIVFARDGDQRPIQKSNEELIKRFPGRDYYTYQFDLSTGRSRLFRLEVDNGRIVDRREIGGYP